MTKTTCQTAIWTPGWYELDQSLTVGERQKFWFYQDPPGSLSLAAKDHEDADLVFYNQLDSDKNSVVRYAKITEIYHPQLGRLSRVDTDGLDYIFYPVEGSEIVVNAEEEPGAAYDTQVDIADWSVWVKLTEVSAPMAHLT